MIECEVRVPHSERAYEELADQRTFVLDPDTWDEFVAGSTSRTSVPIRAWSSSSLVRSASSATERAAVVPRRDYSAGDGSGGATT